MLILWRTYEKDCRREWGLSWNLGADVMSPCGHRERVGSCVNDWLCVGG